MKYRILAIISLFTILCSCTYRPKEKRLTKFEIEDGDILHSFYKMNNDTIEFKRILDSDTGLILQSGQIYYGEFALTYQQFTSRKKIVSELDNIDSLKATFEREGFLSRMTTHRDVMFIQMVPDSGMGPLASLGFMNLRQVIEGKIDAKLQSQNLGEWFAGDMGAGANMLFFINDWNTAMGVVTEVLKDEQLLDHVLITKRIMTSEDDWHYEVVYPVGYEGIFNEM